MERYLNALLTRIVMTKGNIANVFQICHDETHYSLYNYYIVSDEVACLPIGHIILLLCKVIVGWMPLWPSDEALIYYITCNHIWGCHVNGHYPNFLPEWKRDCKTAMGFWTNYQITQISFWHSHTYTCLYIKNHTIIKCIYWKLCWLIYFFLFNIFTHLIKVTKGNILLLFFSQLRHWTYSIIFWSHCLQYWFNAKLCWSITSTNSSL